MVKRFFLSAISVLSLAAIGVCGNLGKYIPLPVQEDVVGLFFVGKAAYCVTDHSILLENAGYFSSKYTCEDTITSSIYDNGKFWIGTSKELAWVDVNTFTRNVVEFPEGMNPRVASIFTDNAHNVWILTRNNGVFKYNNGSFEQVLSKTNIVCGKVFDNGSVCVASADDIFMYDNGQWHTVVKDSVLKVQLSDGLQNILTQGNDNLWVISQGYTCAYKVFAKQTVDSLVINNVYANNGLLVKNMTAVESFGFLFNTNKGIFRSTYTRTPYLMDEFVRNASPRNLMDVVESNISEKMARSTGYKKADYIISDKATKSVWFVNSNGAIRLSLSDMNNVVK